MSLRDPNVQKVLIIVVFLAIVGYMYFGTTFFPFCYQVRSAQITELENQHAKLSADLEKARKTVGKLAQLEEQYQRLHEQWLSAQELLPEEQEMPELLRQVTAAGNKAGVEFTLFQPSSAVAKDVYKEHPVRVEVRGSYHNLGLFLGQLANMSRIVNVEQLIVQPTQKTKNDKKGVSDRHTVTADFTLKAYTLIEGSPATAEVKNDEQG